jgi:pyridoxamine 5'-phosphate oxidase
VPSKRPSSVDPIGRFRRWLKAARKAGAPLAEAAALATVDSRQRPSVRYVLVKTADEDGLVFYTNRESRKGRDLARNPHASMVFYWDATGRQVRIEGRVVEVSPVEADAYWAERPRDSRIASLVSRQSEPLSSRAKLDAAYRAAKRRYRGMDVPRPERWIGYRLVPARFEFWTRREPRLHIRESFERAGDGWKETLLQP